LLQDTFFESCQPAWRLFLVYIPITTILLPATQSSRSIRSGFLCYAWALRSQVPEHILLCLNLNEGSSCHRHLITLFCFMLFNIMPISRDAKFCVSTSCISAYQIICVSSIRLDFLIDFTIKIRCFQRITP